MSRQEVSLPDDAPVSLDEAARICLRGVVKASTLRAAAERGELAVERLGRRIVTTPADVNAWREMCRDRERARTCAFGPRDTGTGSSTKPPAGSSKTDDGSLAQEAALMALRRLREPCATTSPRSTRRKGENVISIKSGSRM
jgi:hypothetical protein